MPTTGDITITVKYTDGTTETFTVAAADAATLVKGDVVIKFKGTLSGDADAKSHEMTRANIKRITYVTT